MLDASKASVESVQKTRSSSVKLAADVAAGVSAGTINFLKETFVFDDQLKGQYDPVVQDIVRETLGDLEDAARWVRQVHNEVMDAVEPKLLPDDPTAKVKTRRQSIHQATTERFLELMKEIKDQLVAPIPVENVDHLRDAMRLLYGDKIVDRAELDAQERSPEIKVEEGKHTKLRTLLTVTALDNIRALIQLDARYVTDDAQHSVITEAAHGRLKALALEIERGNLTVEELVNNPEQQSNREFLGAALSHFLQQMVMRERIIMRRAIDIVSCLTGVSRKYAATFMSEKQDTANALYKAFYSGEWMVGQAPFTLQGWARLQGDMSGNLMKNKDKDGALNPLVFVEMIARLRGRESLAKFSQKLAQHGLRVDANMLAQAPDRIGPDGKERTQEELVEMGLKPVSQKRMDEVADYIDMELASKITSVDSSGAQVQAYPAPAATNSHRYDAYRAAQGILSRYGIQPGTLRDKDTRTFERHELEDGTEVLLPKQIIDLLNETLESSLTVGEAQKPTGLSKLRAALSDDPDLANITIRSTLYSVFEQYTQASKLGLTVGPIITAASYYVGNTLGMIMQMYQGLGVRGMSRVIRNSEMFRSGVITSVVGRLYGQQYRHDDGQVIVTKDGRMYSSDMMADLAQQQGLDTSFIGNEVVRDLLTDIKREHPKALRAQQDLVDRLASLTRGADVSALRDWQRTLIDAATAADNFFRLAIFIDRLVEGDSPTAAAKVARDIGYDYSRLTDREKKYMKVCCLFYSYLKVNTVFFLQSLLKNPSRVMGQFRMLRGLQRMAIDDEQEELFIVDYLENRPILRQAQNVLPGKLMYMNAVNDARTKQYVTVFPAVLPAVEAVAFLQDVARSLPVPFIGTFKQEALEAILPSLHPILTTGFALVTETNPLSGSGLKDDVPALMIKMDRAWTGGQVVDGCLNVQVKDNKYGQRTFVPTTATRQFGVTGQQFWYSLNALLPMVPGLGRSLSTLETFDRADVPILAAGTPATASLVAKFREADVGIVESPILLGSRVGLGRAPRAGYMADNDYGRLEGGAYINPATARPGMSRLGEFGAYVGARSTALPSRAQLRENEYRAQQTRIMETMDERTVRDQDLRLYDREDE